MLLDKATGANSIVQDKYITISINKKSVEDARTYFSRVGADLIAHFGRLGSKCVELETDERLRIFHDFYRVGEESSFHFDIKETRKKGHDFKDYICPDTMEFEKDYFKMGNRYGRVLFLREYASYIKDSMVAELTDMNRNLMMSIDIVPVPTDEAVKEAENRLLGVETNITNWQRRQNANNNFSATVPYDMEQQKKEMKEFLDDLTTRDQRMMFAVITMVITADSKEQLENDTEALLTTARKHLCQFATLRFQQVDGLNTVMPFGTRKIDAFRTLTTESLSVFIPFRVQDIFHENGIYYGQNVISKNMIIADRKQLLNGNSFILGVSGGGKSFAAKGEIINQVLSSDADISTIITLTTDYLKTLSIGTHTFEIVWTDGSASTNFTVSKNNSGSETRKDDDKNKNDNSGSQTGDNQHITSPQTGDNSHPTLWISLLGASLIGLLATLYMRKKKDNE